jgi:hypothetical protein
MGLGRRVCRTFSPAAVTLPVVAACRQAPDATRLTRRQERAGAAVLRRTTRLGVIDVWMARVR